VSAIGTCAGRLGREIASTFCTPERRGRRGVDLARDARHPRAYLRDTLAKILAGEKDLTALLPETYAASLAPRAPDVAA
jgi:hypothetical protein